MDDLMAKGAEVYSANCVACHQANGEGIPGAFPPLVNGKAFAGAADAMQRLRERGFLNQQDQIVLGPVEDHIALVMSGVSGTAMAAFGSQLSDVELAVVITYERNAWGNDTGDVVQPMAVKALR
jgi:cytochrome c oxidase subunit 2